MNNECRTKGNFSRKIRSYYQSWEGSWRNINPLRKSSDRNKKKLASKMRMISWLRSLRPLIKLIKNGKTSPKLPSIILSKS